MNDIAPYIRASKKQLEYIAKLCNELGCVNRSLYEKFSLVRANKEITRLKRRLVKQQKAQMELHQTSLF